MLGDDFDIATFVEENVGWANVSNLDPLGVILRCGFGKGIYEKPELIFLNFAPNILPVLDFLRQQKPIAWVQGLDKHGSTFAR